MITAQCRAARGLLGWTQERLAGESGVSLTTVRNFERGATNPTRVNLAAMRNAFEAAGVDFIDPNGNGPGVQLRK